MKAQSTLPEGYKEIFSVNLQTNKKIAMFVNVLATLIAVVLAVPAHFIVPIQTLFDMSDGLVVYAIRFMVNGRFDSLVLLFRGGFHQRKQLNRI